MTAKDIVVFLDKLGMWDVIVPFILVFTVVYAVLEKTKVLGEEKGEPKHRFNAVAAFVIASFTIIAADVLNVVSRFSQYVVIFLVASLCLAILLAFFGFKDIQKHKIGKWVVFPVLFIILIIGILYAFGWLSVLDWSAVGKYSGVILAFAVFLFVIWVILRGEKKPGADSAKPEESKTPGWKKVASVHPSDVGEEAEI